MTRRYAEGKKAHDSDEFLADPIGMFVSSYSVATQTNYRLKLRLWEDFCRTEGIKLLEASGSDIQAWSRRLSDNGVMDSSVASYLTCVRSFYYSAFKSGAIPMNPAGDTERPQHSHLATSVAYGRKNVAQLVNSAARKDAAAFALTCLFALNGLTLSECLTADVEDFDMSADPPTMTIPSRAQRTGMIITLGHRTAEAVSKAIGGRSSGALLLGKNGERLNGAALRRKLVRVQKAAGLLNEVVVTPTALRHSFYDMAKQAGVSTHDIVERMGVNSISALDYHEIAD